MRLRHLCVLLPLALGVVSCSSSPEPMAPPVSPGQLSEMRDEFRRSDPDARVGEVTAVLPNSNLAAVGGVNPKDFLVGDIITFLDSNRKFLTMGKVEAVNRNSLTVHYDNPTDRKGRAPVQGDIAVRAIR